MESVSHKGKIVSITPSLTTVEIMSESACASCHAAGLCGMSERKKKLIEVPTLSWETREVGQEVNVLLKASMGRKAVWVAYVAPLLVLVAVLLALLASGVSEPVSGLSAIGAVALYYIVIWLLRDRLRDQYVFTIE